MYLSYPFKVLGKSTILFIRELGSMVCFLVISLYHMVLPPYLIGRIIKRIYFIGVKTILVITLTGLFTGMVLSLQSYHVLATLGAESKLGSIIALSLIRELGPVIAALMVVGRVGSALTAEIGIMRISEQIDALDAMALDPRKYLVAPNLLAGFISLPILTFIFIVVGIWGGYLVGVELTGISRGTYFGAITSSIVLEDILLSLYKSLCFGVLITWISCYKGFSVGRKTGFGAEGVSKATTQAVVLASISILVSDYYITSVMISI